MEDFNSKYTGEQVEELLDMVANGEAGGGGGIAVETDPIFSASPAASITDAKKAEWDGKQDAIADLATIRSGAEKGATALQSIPEEYVTESELSAKGYATTAQLDGKVDKESGKGLSAEDFTSELKNKLESLNNYDDTELSNALATLREDFDKLVSGDTTTAIKTFNEVIAFLDGITDTEDLTGIIASIEQQIAGKMDKVTLATVATSGSYNDLADKPTIPSAVTETTVSGWGFTKNTGTYSKPSGGIPKSDLASAVQTSLGKADTALQSYTEQYKGTVTGVKVNGTTKSPSSGTVDIGNVVTSVKINGSSKTPSSGVVDLGTVITSHQDISGKQDKLVSGTNIKTINGTSILGSGDITISGGSGGSSGGGSKEFVEFETNITPVGYDGFIQLAQMNKIYVSDKPLTYMFIAELESGIEGEVSFHFVASKEGCTLGLPSGVIWANGKVPDNHLTDCYCELSIVAVKNINTYIYKAVLSTIPYGHNVVLQAGDNGQIGVDTYNYMVSHGVTDAVGTIDWTAAIEDNILLNADGLDNQRLERASISPGDPSRWFSLRWFGQLYWVAYLRPDGYLDIEYDD